MRFVKSIPLSLLFYFFSASSVLAQVATAPASPTSTLVPTGGGEATSGGELPAAGFAAPTIILLALGAFFLIVGVYKLYQTLSKR